jgi:hypothetical protein
MAECFAPKSRPVTAGSRLAARSKMGNVPSPDALANKHSRTLRAVRRSQWRIVTPSCSRAKRASITNSNLREEFSRHRSFCGRTLSHRATEKWTDVDGCTPGQRDYSVSLCKRCSCRSRDERQLVNGRWEQEAVSLNSCPRHRSAITPISGFGLL